MPRFPRNSAALLLAGGLLMAEPSPGPASDCVEARTGLSEISRTTKVRHALLLKAVELFHRASTSEEKAQALRVLQSMNLRTADRIPNSGLTEASETLREAYREECGGFDAEDEKILLGIVERNRIYNEVLARELGDELSLSKLR